MPWKRNAEIIERDLSGACGHQQFYAEKLENMVITDSYD